MKKLTVISSFLLVLAIFLAGCGPSAVVVRERPVAPVVVRPVAPGAGYVWVEGNYVRRGRGYVYSPGYWAVPPRGRSAYRPGYWVQSPRGYYYKRGRWYAEDLR